MSVLCWADSTSFWRSFRGAGHHLETAEVNYQKNKEIKKQQELQGNKKHMIHTNTKHYTEENREVAKQVFFNMVKVKSVNIGKDSINALAKKLHDELKKTFMKPYSIPHLHQKLIPVWRKEYIDTHKKIVIIMADNHLIS